jgi:RNA recognition motif-containing protein
MISWLVIFLMFYSIQTGKSKHYGFIEFKHKEVAKIAADTMDGHLMFNHVQILFQLFISAITSSFSDSAGQIDG